MRDGLVARPAHPQIAHNLFQLTPAMFVEKLWIRYELLARNALAEELRGLYARGFLPTMKFQLSQLP